VLALRDGALCLLLTAQGVEKTRPYLRLIALLAPGVGLGGGRRPCRFSCSRVQ
jgi:hypothetical protein